MSTSTITFLFAIVSAVFAAGATWAILKSRVSTALRICKELSSWRITIDNLTVSIHQDLDKLLNRLTLLEAGDTADDAELKQLRNDLTVLSEGLRVKIQYLSKAEILVAEQSRTIDVLTERVGRNAQDIRTIFTLMGKDGNDGNQQGN